MAACMPLGRIEVLADDMVPRRQHALCGVTTWRQASEPPSG
jgi:hypothetical protein